MSLMAGHLLRTKRTSSRPSIVPGMLTSVKTREIPSLSSSSTIAASAKSASKDSEPRFLEYGDGIQANEGAVLDNEDDFDGV